MPRRLSGLALALAGLLVLPMVLPAQEDAREVAELRRRITIIRAQLPAITEAAEYAAGHLKADSTKRILVPKSIDPGLSLEFYYRAGGPPESGNADDPGRPRRRLCTRPVRASSNWSS